LGPKLGPILWQFPPNIAFAEKDFASFLELLPAAHAGVPLQHVVEVRHRSFLDPRFIALLRAHKTPLVIVDSPKYPEIYGVTGDFVYLRLQRSEEAVATGYTEDALDLWAARARAWSAGEQPQGMPLLVEAPAPQLPRPSWIFMIDGAKVRAPAAAQAMIAKLG